MADSLAKRRNAAAKHKGDTLRVNLSTSMDCIVPLPKEKAAIAGKARLNINADKHAEPGIIKLTEY